MDWTGTRLSVTGGIGQLILSAGIIGPYTRGEQGIVDFVTRYAQDAISRRRLDRIVVTDPAGQPLGDIYPARPKTPF